MAHQLFSLSHGMSDQSALVFRSGENDVENLTTWSESELGAVGGSKKLFEHSYRYVFFRDVLSSVVLFSPRNSFSACSAKGKIYIWGGLEMAGIEQKILSDFI